MLRTRFNKFVLALSIAGLSGSGFAAPIYDIGATDPDAQQAAPAPAGEPSLEVVPDNAPQGGLQPQIVTSNLSPEQRLGRVEQQVQNLTQSDYTAKAKAMENEIQMLRGQIDELQHNLQQLQDLQRKQYMDLDQRLSHQVGATPAAVETKTTTTATTSETAATAPTDSTAATPATPVHATKSTVVTKTTTQAAQPDASQEAAVYQTAYNFIKAGKYDDAITALQSFLEKYPHGQFAVNAHYWLGELYNITSKPDQAITEFNTVINQFPASAKVPDSMLKLGLIYTDRSNWPQAKQMFSAVLKRYPNTGAARLATEQVKQMKQAGHW